jgi:hypothetical protein
MAGLFDYQDPDSVGRMMFAAGLLNAAGPSKMPVSTGQALAQGLMARQQGATEAGQSSRRNLFLEAQARHLDAQARNLDSQSKNPDGNLPAAVKTAIWYSKASPAEKEAFGFSVRNNVVKGPNGELYMNEPGVGLRRLTDLEQTAMEKQFLAQSAAFGTEAGKAPWDVKPVFSGGKDTFATTPDILAGLGRTPQRPMLSAFNQPSPIANAPRVGQPMSRPNVDAVGVPPNGVRTIEELRAAIAAQDNAMPMPSTASQPSTAAQPSLASPTGIQPPAAGDAARAGEKEAAVKSEAYRAKLRESYPKAQAAYSDLTQSIDRGLKMVKDLENSKGAWLNTGYISNLPTRYVKGSPAFQDEANMQTLRDQIVIKTIMSMKALSQTGATGFGQLSEKEGARLENNIATLITGQTAEGRKKALAEIKASFENIKENAKTEYNTEFGAYEAEALRKKHGLK